MTPPPWRVSLHGGHSGQYCDHAKGTLREVIQSAADREMQIFGVSEHVPRTRPDLLYRDEIALGWTVDTLSEMFEAYAEELRELVDEFADRLVVLRGFETEVVPERSYVESMRALRSRHAVDFIVGSVHHVDEILIDGPVDLFEDALRGRGGLEATAIRYYELVASMVEQLSPEVVGHLDLIRKNGRHYGEVDTPPIREAACRALDVVAAHDAILDLNVAALRKGMDTPYPDPWLIGEARRRGIGFCFGDDSHGPELVGEGLEAGRRYLLDNGVDHIRVLNRVDGEIVRQRVSLLED